MILSDRESKLRLAREHVRITPLPDADKFSSMAIDLSLDEGLKFDPFKRIGLVEARWDFRQNPRHDTAAS